MLRKPIFISGLRKSGTSMVRMLFDGHPEVFVPPCNELKFMHYSTVPALCSHKDFSSDNIDEIKEHMLSDRTLRALGDRDSNFWREEFDYEGFLADVRSKRCETMEELIENMMHSFASRSSDFSGDVLDTRYVIKGEMQTEYFLELRAMFPDMKALYVLRNPYAHFTAVRNSYRMDSLWDRKLKPSRNLSSRELTWRDRYPFVLNHLMYMKSSYCFMSKFAKLFPESFKVVVFDDILMNPEGVMREVAEFVGIEFTDALVMPTLNGRVWGGNSMLTDKEFNGIDKGPLTHWKSSITSGEIKLINTHFQWVIERFGFELERSDASFYRPFHYTEMIKRYVANRVAFFMR